MTPPGFRKCSSTSIRASKNPSPQMAVEAGTGLPGHVDPKDWKPMTVDKNELTALEDDILADIEDHGFSFYKMVPPS